MKLVHPHMEGKIVLEAWESCEWIIESPELFSSVIQELLHQTDGDDGRFVLSENEKELPFPKNVEVIANPLAVDINERKILGKLYGELEKTALGEELYLETQEIAEKFYQYFLLLEQAGGFMIETSLQADPAAWFKAFGVKFVSYGDSFQENICQYLMIVSELLKKRLVVFINLKSYLCEEQIKEVEKTAAYNEVALIFLENVQRPSPKERKKYIIDVDGCEIF